MQKHIFIKRDGLNIYSNLQIFLGILAYSLSLLRYLQIHEIRHYDADLLYIPTFFQDIYRWGGSFFEWRLTPAPYLFPDMLIYFPLARLIANWHIALLFSLLLQVMLFTLGWCLLGKYLFKEDRHRKSYIVLTLLIVSLLFVFPHTLVIVQPQFVISSHFGVMLMIPYVVILTLKLLNNQFVLKHIRYTVVSLTIILSLITLSDSITYVQLLFPLLVAVFFIGLTKKMAWKHVFSIVIYIAISLVCMQVLKLWLIQYPTLPATIQSLKLPPRMGASLVELANLVIEYWNNDHRIVVILFLVAIGVHLLISLQSIYAAINQQEFNENMMFLSVFLLSSFFLTLLSVIGLGLIFDRMGMRYIYPLLVLPIYSLIPIGHLFLDKLNVEWWFIAIVGIFIITKQLGALNNLQTLDQHVEHYPSLVSCIDMETSKRGTQAGVGSYWDAKYISILSKNDLKISQVNSDFSPDIWINSIAWYKRFPPEFVVFDPSQQENNLDMAWLINTYGYPQEIVNCQLRELWFYNRPEDSFFQTFFADHPALVNWCQANIGTDIVAYVWRGKQGVNINTSIVADHQEGQIAHGILRYHPFGQYELDIHYQYAGNIVNQTIGELKIGRVRFGKDQRPIEWDDYPLLANQNMQKITFDVKEFQHVIVDVHFNGDGVFTLNNFYLQKVGGSPFVDACYK